MVGTSRRGKFQWLSRAPRSCRNRSWAHNLCVESDWPSSQTLHCNEQRHRVLFCSFPTKPMTLRVVTANKKGDETTGRKEADEKDIQHGHDEERENML